jgi:hypothetical protein
VPKRHLKRRSIVLHLDDGVLRRLFDDPLGTLASARRHYSTCTVCQQRAAELAENARATAAAFDADNADAHHANDTHVAFRAKLGDAGRLKALVRQPIRFGTAPRYIAPLIGVAAAAAVVVLFIFTPLNTVARSFLTIFEPQQFTPISVSRRDRQAIRALPPLQAYGSLREISHPKTEFVKNAAQASTLAHMSLRLPQTVPPNVKGAARFEVSTPGIAMFTFSAAKARSAALAAHRHLPVMPSGLDGSTLQVSAGPVVLMTYGGRSPRSRSAAARDAREGDVPDFPGLVIAQAPLPRVVSTGVSVRQIEAYLLNMPGVPPALAAQIAAIGDPSTTLPIPVPIDRETAQAVTVQGVQGLAVGDNTGVGAGVVWQQNGYIYGVAGNLTQSEILAIANSLR